MKKSQEFLTYTRNFIFGAEDSLVSTVGLLIGIAAGGLTNQDIVITGITLIFVEAVSMGVGSYLSELATEESYKEESNAFRESLIASIIMFLSYVLSGLVPLLPFVFLSDTRSATFTSIIATFIALFILGIISAKLLKIKFGKIATRMAVLGGIAIVIGYIIGGIAGKY